MACSLEEEPYDEEPIVQEKEVKAALKTLGSVEAGLCCGAASNSREELSGKKLEPSGPGSPF